VQLSELKGKVDFGIITIREDEFAAVLARFPPISRVTGRRQYNLHRVPLTGGGSYLVAVVRCIEQGNLEAQSVANDLIEDLHPHWLLVVGIAGAAPADELSLGDVIVPVRIHDFNVEALLQDGTSEYALGGGPIDKSAATHVANLLALGPELGSWNSSESVFAPRPDIPLREELLYGDEAWNEKVRRSLERHAGRKLPLVTTGAIASSDRLIKRTETLAVWMKMARHVRAVEMESAGVYRATYGRQIPVVSIRGISDVVGLIRDPEWTHYACHTAAAFTLALMQTRPFAPRTHAASSVHDRKLPSWVAQWPLPRVAEVDPYQLLGVTESDRARRYAKQDERPPYILRDADSELDKALLASDLVLLAGHSKAGKTRTAFEALLRLYPQQPLLIPFDGKALAEIFRLEPPLQWNSDPLIIWLDDLQRFLGPDGLNFSVLNALSQVKGRVKLLATLTSKRYESYMSSTSDVEKDLQLILRRFKQVRLSSDLSEVETQRATALYQDEPRQKLAEGLGEHFVAAHELIRRYDTGKESCPQGYVLVRATIDWRRAGLLRPIPETALKRLAAQYLRFLKIPHVDLTPEAYNEGLQWARKPVGLHISLLSGAGGDSPEKSFEAFDYIVDHAERQGSSLPDEGWKAILQLVAPHEAIDVGLSAYHQQNKALTEQALAQAIQSGDADDRSRAVFILGVIYQEDGKFDEAEHAFRQVLDSQQAEIATWAMTQLGQILRNKGELEEAEQFFQRAFDAKHPDSTVDATLGLGSLLLDKGEWDKAEHLFQSLSHSTDPRDVAMATVNLGRVHELRGDRVQAERLYQQAIDAKHPDAVSMAMNNLGGIYLERGDLAKAEQLFREASNSAQAETAAIAKANLGSIFHNRGELEQAEQIYRAAIDSKQPFAVALATNNLGAIAYKRGDLADARRLFQRALDFNHPDVVPIVSLSMGSLLHDQKELLEASKLLRGAIAARHPHASPRASLVLGALLEQQGEYAEAEHHYREALASRRAVLIPVAAHALGSLLQDLDRDSEAEPFLQQAMESNDPDIVDKATLLLGISLMEQEKVTSAEPLFRRLLDCKDAKIALAACACLGKLLEKRGELVSAEHYLRKAAECEEEIIWAGSSVELGKLLLRKGEVAEATRFFQKAAGSSDEEVVQEARKALEAIARGHQAPPS
jgi:tetratricopeptide (TPR) repeat protein/nucleoside phosphorylase